MINRDIFACLESLILSCTCNFFAYIKFHSDCGRAIGKIKQNELDCRDTAPLSNYDDDHNDNLKQQLVLSAKQQLCTRITLICTFL